MALNVNVGLICPMQLEIAPFKQKVIYVDNFLKKSDQKSTKKANNLTIINSALKAFLDFHWLESISYNTSKTWNID